MNQTMASTAAMYHHCHCHAKPAPNRFGIGAGHGWATGFTMISRPILANNWSLDRSRSLHVRRRSCHRRYSAGAAANFVSNSNPNSNFKFNPNSNSNPNPNSGPNSNSNPNPNSGPNRNSDPNSNSRRSIPPSISPTLDYIATFTILRENPLDVASHAISDLLHRKLVTVSLVSLSDLHPETKEARRSDAAGMRFDSGSSSTEESGGGEANSKSTMVIKLKLKVARSFGKPGAVLIDNQHENEFFLKTVTVDMPDGSSVHFSCYSWISDTTQFNGSRPRVFFSNQAYLPGETPEALKKMRVEEMEAVKGDGRRRRMEGERIYEYDVYRDLGDPDKNLALRRPILGGSSRFPYPRRCRTGRPPTNSDPFAEQPTPSFETPYLPRDEYFSPLKNDLFTSATLKCFGHDAWSALENMLAHEQGNQPFKSFKEIYDLYVDGLNIKLAPPTSPSLNSQDGPIRLNFPTPGVIAANKDGWCTDQEFARQRLAGPNPLCIQRLTEFPMKSTLNEETYGPSESSITKEHLEPYLDGLTVEEAMKNNLLFILDYHDAIMPYVNKINEGEGKIYASRTIFHVTKKGFLLPLAIELSLPPKRKGGKGFRRVLTAPPPNVVDWEWRLAKMHVLASDAGIHELVSHWLRTHACVEPFIIATHRCLSAMHPLYMFLQPHFKDTMHINALARTALINAGGIIEKCFTPGRYSLEISSSMYKSWRFDEQALPKDLLKRGMAVEDPSSRHGVRLIIEDYPYAEDGLELWMAMEDWVAEYVGIYYKKDEDVEGDNELQGWWKEIREVGHGDHANASWWSTMKTIGDLRQVLTTLLWLTSAQHAAVNFGQYAYSGFMPNYPTISKRLLADNGGFENSRHSNHDYKQQGNTRKPNMQNESIFLNSISSQGQATLIMATVELLSTHLSDEEYLGHRNDPRWTSDPRVLVALHRFCQSLLKIEQHIRHRTRSASPSSHRMGPTFLPYTLLCPASYGEGLTFRGIPNSISI